MPRLCKKVYELVESSGAISLLDGSSLPYQDWEVLLNNERVFAGSFSMDISKFGQIEEEDICAIMESNQRSRRSLTLAKEMVRLANLGAELERRCALAEKEVVTTGYPNSIGSLPDKDRIGQLVKETRKSVRKDFAMMVGG